MEERTNELKKDLEKSSDCVDLLQPARKSSDHGSSIKINFASYTQHARVTRP